MTTVIVFFPVAESSILEHLTHDKCGANEREAMFEMTHILGYANSARTSQILSMHFCGSCTRRGSYSPKIRLRPARALR